jgi:flagellar biosynthesis protein FlhF
MRIKRFEAPDTKTALAMVKAEMGEDAIILASRTIAPVRDGVAKKGHESWVEVVAAMDYDLEDLARQDNSSPERNGTRTAPPARVPAENQAVAAGSHPRTSLGATACADQAQPMKGVRISGAVQELRKSFIRPPLEPPAGSSQNAPSPPGSQSRAKAEEVARWRDQLIGKLRITGSASQTAAGTPLIIALVGATGVGKTTTAAKLAAWYTLREGCKVALLSMDCYRIGATDQLRTYARIMRLPCEITLRKNELRQAIDRHRHKDVIIIDTAGKSPFDEQHITELREWFAVDDSIRPHLVISATTKKEDLAKVLETYAPLAPESLIITKLDETRAYAAVCQQVVAAALPVSYLCTGQRVPEDFLVASRDFLEKLFKQGWQAVAPELQAAAAPDQWQENINIHQRQDSLSPSIDTGT